MRTDEIWGKWLKYVARNGACDSLDPRRTVAHRDIFTTLVETEQIQQRLVEMKMSTIKVHPPMDSYFKIELRAVRKTSYSTLHQPEAKFACSSRS